MFKYTRDMTDKTLLEALAYHEQQNAKEKNEIIKSCELGIIKELKREVNKRGLK